MTSVATSRGEMLWQAADLIERERFPPGALGLSIPPRLGFRRIAWTALARSATRARTKAEPTGTPREVLAWISDVERLLDA